MCCPSASSPPPSHGTGYITEDHEHPIKSRTECRRSRTGDHSGRDANMMAGTGGGGSADGGHAAVCACVGCRGGSRAWTGVRAHSKDASSGTRRREGGTLGGRRPRRGAWAGSLSSLTDRSWRPGVSGYTLRRSRRGENPAHPKDITGEAAPSRARTAIVKDLMAQMY